MMYYLHLCLRLARMSCSVILSNRIDSCCYLFGKILRFFFFLLFIFSLFQFISSFAGYSQQETLLFFLTYSFLDVLSQLLFRGIYFFRHTVRTGAFDFVLIKPVHALVYVLTQLTDLLDAVFLIPILICLGYVLWSLPYSLSISALLWYIFFLCVSMVLITSFHIITAALTVRYADADQSIWLYRELMAIGRFPSEALPVSLQFVCTTIIPIIIVVSFPVRALVGSLSWWSIGAALSITIVFLCSSLLLWSKSVRAYASASS